MLDIGAGSAMSNWGLPQIVLAIGGLGTAAYGVVDATKSLGGGISNRGFGDIKRVVAKCIPSRPGEPSPGAALTFPSVLATLRANWLNGMALADQKSVAKALIKLNLTQETASSMAAAAGVNADVLKSVAAKLSTGESLSQQETDTYGRFDLLLTALLDQGYQRGDQRYRNSAKLLAVPVAILLALLGALAIDKGGLTCIDALKAVAGGLLATPLAPVAKDLSSAIQAGATLAQAWKK